MTDRERYEDLGTARVVETWLDESVHRLPDGEALPDALMRRVVEGVEGMPQEGSRSRWLRRLLGGGGSSSVRLTPGLRIAAASVIAVASVAVGIGLVTRVGPFTRIGDTYVVAADGSAGFSSISAAVAAAREGDTILVRPGHYTEAIVLDKAVTLRGDGGAADIIISAPDDGPAWDAGSALLPGPAAYAIVVSGADAVISGITFSGETARIIVDGGAASLEGLVFDGVGGAQQDMASRTAGSLVIGGGAPATVRGSIFAGPGPLQVIEDADTIIEGNSFIEGASIEGAFGDDAVVRGNRIVDPPLTAIAFLDPMAGTLEANEISGGIFGISSLVDYGGDAFAPRIVGNTITDTPFGVILPAGSEGEVRDNTLRASRQAISLTDARTLVADNQLEGNDIGIRVAGGAPTLQGNSVTGGTTGIEVLDAATPTLADNSVCGNQTDLAIGEGTVVPDVTDNEVCAGP